MNAIAKVMAWLRDVEPQLGTDVDYAQVDVDTLIPIRGATKRDLVPTCLAMFAAVAEDSCFDRRDLYWELSIPVDHGTWGMEPPSGTDIAALLPQVDFTGRLQGRQMPGFFLSTRPFPDRLQPKMRRKTQLVWSEMPRCVVHHRVDVWGELNDPLDVTREDAIDVRLYPDVIWREAKFPLDS